MNITKTGMSLAGLALLIASTSCGGETVEEPATEEAVTEEAVTEEAVTEEPATEARERPTRNIDPTIVRRPGLELPTRIRELPDVRPARIDPKVLVELPRAGRPTIIDKPTVVRRPVVRVSAVAEPAGLSGTWKYDLALLQESISDDWAELFGSVTLKIDKDDAFVILQESETKWTEEKLAVSLRTDSTLVFDEEDSTGKKTQTVLTLTEPNRLVSTNPAWTGLEFIRVE